MRRRVGLALAIFLLASGVTHAQRYSTSDGKLRVALAKQPFSPTGLSAGPTTMANGGIQQILAGMNVTLRMDEAALTPSESTEYGGWKRLGMALGHFADIVAKNEQDGYFTVGLLATCPSMPGLVAGLQHSGSNRKPLKIGMLWLDAHPDFNTPETTRSGSLGGMPVAVATGRALKLLRLDAQLDPPLQDQHVVMAGVRLTDPLEQELLDRSSIQQLSVDDLRNMTPAVFAQLDRLSQLTDKIYIHIDMDVLDPREVMGHGNKVPDGPSSEELAKLFEVIFSRYPKASAIGFATIPSTDEGGLSIAAVNRMIEGAIRGLKARETGAVGQEQEPRVRVSGIVVDWQYARVLNTTIRFESEGQVKEVKVNEVGEYEIDLPPGHYVVKATATHFRERRVKLHLKPATPRILNLMLTVPPQRFRCPKGAICL